MREAEFGIYIYGIVSGAEPLPNMPGIDGLHPLYAILCRDLKAIVSQVSLAEFGEKPLEEKLQDLRWLEQKVRAHEAIVEQVLGQQAILPCKFCTIYRSAGRLRNVLARYNHECHEALAFLHDKEEWGVKAYVDEEMLWHHLLQTDDELNRMEQERVGKSPGLAYLMKKTLEQHLAERMDQTIAHFSGQLMHELGSYAVQAQEASPAALHACPPGTHMLLNTTYLIAKEQVRPFGACARGLNERVANDGVRLVLSGPWPPYHFSPRLA
ncbi:MAG: GvpL/GvpF family gas vesicle protein [Nitrospinae bacterium]|nr:GvpL/GvpF family gas vesicle protein [Nitrospinota bacterium]